MPKFPESLASRSQAAATIDPRLERALRRIVLVGLLAVMLLPAARGSSALLGWLPLWLLAMPLGAWWALHRFALPRWPRPVAMQRRRRTRPRRVAAARRCAAPRATARCLNPRLDAASCTLRLRPDLRQAGPPGRCASVAGLARSRSRAMSKLSHACSDRQPRRRSGRRQCHRRRRRPGRTHDGDSGGPRPVPVAGRRARREAARLGARAERQGRGRARQHRASSSSSRPTSARSSTPTPRSPASRRSATTTTTSGRTSSTSAACGGARRWPSTASRSRSGKRCSTSTR